MKKICMIVVCLFFINIHNVYAVTAVGDEAYNAYKKATYYYKEQDYKNELKWLKISFQEEKTKEIAFNIGLSYENLEDYESAIKWYKKAFEMGNTDGGVNVALIYANILKNRKGAIEWNIKAYNKGDAGSANNLAILYEDEKDFINSTKWYKKAINKGHINARKNLGLLYHKLGDDLHSAVYMMGMIGHPYTKERVMGLLRNTWKIDEPTLKKAYELQKKLVPDPYTGGIE